MTSAVAGAAGQVTSIQFNGDSNIDDWAIGHVTLQRVKTLSTELATELNAHVGEKAGDRIRRLCDEEGIKCRIEGDPADTEAMGPQRPLTLMSLLEECANTDLGILHEARSARAVGYRTRASMQDQDTLLPPASAAPTNWWSTRSITSTNDPTIANQVSGSPASVLGSGIPDGPEEPAISLGNPTLVVPDGTDDYLQLNVTPTFTPTTGELTVIFVGVWDSDDTTDSSNRLVSSESAGSNGLLMHTSGTGMDFPKITVGGATTTVQVSPPGTPSLSNGDVFAVAAVIDDGTLAAYLRGSGLSATSSITGVGTITHSAFHAFARSFDKANPAHSSMRDIMIFDAALTEAELDNTTKWLINYYQTGQLAFDYEVGELASSPKLDRDDQGFANDVKVENWNGSTARAELNDGSALSVSEPPDGAGRYDSAYPVNASDSRLVDLAESILSLSAVDEPRVTDLAVALHYSALISNTELTDDVLEASLGDLITVSNNLPIALGICKYDKSCKALGKKLGAINTS